MEVNYLPLVLLLICQSVPNAILWPNHDISTLKLLQVVHRHGDRNAENWFPNDPFKNLSKYWPEGEGQLTTDGKYRMYKIGQIIRNNYQSYLGNGFSPREVYARSSGKHRCLESAQLVLAGAYPPNNTDWQWSHGNDSLLGNYWQPFPIESFLPIDEDRVLRVEAYCPKAREVQTEIYFSSRVKSFLGPHKPMLKEITRKMGRPFTDIEDMNDFWDTLSLEYDRGYKWSDRGIWNQTFENQTLELMKAISTFYWNVKFNNSFIQNIRAGPLIEELTKNMRHKINGSLTQKVMFYSTHDSKLNVLLQTLQVYDRTKLMPFGTTLLFELHQKSNPEEYFVRIYYLNETLPEKSPHLLQLPKCDHLGNCPTTRFLSFTQAISGPLEWKFDCEISDINTWSSFTSLNITLLVINILLVFVLCIVLSIIFCNRRQFFYQPID